MTLLNRDSILKAVDVRTQDVNVPEWGGSIRVRSMTVAERGEFASKAGSDNKVSIGAWLVSVLAVDDKGAPLFKPEDIPELEKRSAKAVDAVTQAILEVNGMDEKKVEAAAKN